METVQQTMQLILAVWKKLTLDFTFVDIQGVVYNACLEGVVTDQVVFVFAQRIVLPHAGDKSSPFHGAL